MPGLKLRLEFFVSYLNVLCVFESPDYVGNGFFLGGGGGESDSICL